jgi:hypothetical protein
MAKGKRSKEKNYLQGTTQKTKDRSTRATIIYGKLWKLKQFLVSQMGYEFEMHGIPDSFKNEINDILWQFIWNDHDGVN